jgi:UDP-N-acetylmuramate--alanine ligase
MSGLARVLHERGIPVTGSDLKPSRYTSMLTALGVPVTIGHDAANVGDPEIVVVSTAIPQSNPELASATALGKEVWPRGRMLAHLAGDDQTLAVAGTHGKTTTSSMLAVAARGIDLDPTFLIGGEVRDVGTNAHCGGGNHYIVEADESDGSFLFLDPYVAIITNIEADHMDHYGSLEEIIETFGRFIDRVHPEGATVVWAEDPGLVALATSRSKARVITYGTGPDATVRCEQLGPEGLGSRYAVTFPDGRRIEGTLAVPGEHNVLNASGVLAALWALGKDVAGAIEALAAFGGVRRRFDKVGEVDGVWVVDDYAHHPTEVKATITAARAAGFDRLWVVFQPHRYSRTEAFRREFGAAFEGADQVVLMDVYSAGEVPIPGVTGKTVLDELLLSEPHAAVAYFPHRADIGGYVADRVRRGDLVMTMGAGDVTTLAGDIVRALEGRAGSAA